MANLDQLRILKSGAKQWNKWREKNPEVEPDLSGANLQAMNLCGCQLWKVDFTKSDIRRTIFADANLEDARFVCARAGFRKSETAIFLVFATLSGLLSGFFSIFAGVLTYVSIETLIASCFELSLPKLSAVVTVGLVALTIGVITISIIKYKVTSVSVAVAMALLLSGELAVFVFVAWFGNREVTAAIGLNVFGALACAGTMVMAFTGAKAVGLAGIFSAFPALAATAAGIFEGYVSLGWVDGWSFVNIAALPTYRMEFVAVTIAALSIIPMSCFFAWHSIHESEEFSSFRKTFITLTSLFGTRFKNTNLTRTNFAGANLKGAHFISPTSLVHTKWNDAKGMHLSYFYGTPLENQKVRHLLCSLDGNKKTDLKGLNLQHAYLGGAALRNADLRNADFDGADLSHADITGAKLYATSRENWEIEGIKCEYVYWDEDGKERMPPDRNFEPGEFEKLYKQLPTFDYFFQGNFTPIDMVIMDRVVQAINDKHPQFELNLDSFSSRSNPHAKFTVFHKEDTDTAYQEIKAQYEARIAALEHDKEKLLALTQTLVDNPRQINQYYMQIEGDVIDIDAQKNVAYAKNQSKSGITDGE